MEQRPRIPELFAGREVFVTGGTGFLGKALIEKLLRSCPDVAAVHVLVRTRRGASADERLRALTADPAFERLRRERPGQLEAKLKALPGDVAQPQLGLQDDARRRLVENVSFVFHGAASVRFDEPLRDAVLLNVRGAREAARLAVDAARHKLLAFVHVSSAFSNCDRSKVDERLYETDADWAEAIAVAELAEPSVLSALSCKYAEGMPNTYTFTKRLAELAVRDTCAGRAPLTIARPSIVVSALDEPEPGWLDNFHGPVALTAAYGRGVMRTMCARLHLRPDYVPVDVVTKAALVAAWDLGVRGQRDRAEVLHCTSDTVRWCRPSVDLLVRTGVRELQNVPLGGALWAPSTHTSASPAACYVRTILFQLVPALLADLVLTLVGRKPMLLKIQRRIYLAGLALRHFSMHEWTYTNRRFMELRDTIPAEDRAAFDYDFADRDLDQFIRNALLGCRRYLFHQPDEDIPKARRHQRIMKWLDRIVKSLLALALCWLLSERALRPCLAFIL